MVWRITMNALKLLTVILIIVAVAVVAVYLMGQFEQTQPTYTQIMGYVDQAKTYATQNWALLAGSIGTIATIGGVAYSKLSSAKQQLTQVADSAKSQIGGLQTAKDELTNKLTQTVSGYESQLKEQTGKLSTVQQQAETYKTQAETAAAQLKQAQDRANAQLELNKALFTTTLPGDKLIMDPTSGALIKTITQTVVK